MSLNELNSATPCLGLPGCLPGVFALSAGLLLLTTLAIFATRHFYLASPVPEKPNLLGRLLHIIVKCRVNKAAAEPEKPTSPRKGLLDYYLYEHVCERDELCVKLGRRKRCIQSDVICGVKSAMGLVLLLVPVPLFWAHFSQYGDLWEMQAGGLSWEVHLLGVVVTPVHVTLGKLALMMAMIPLMQVGRLKCREITR